MSRFPSSVKVRAARASDAKAIKAFDALARSDASRRAFIDRSIKSHQCFIAVVDDRVVAYGVLNHTFYDQGFVSMLYVHPEYRQRGIGSALMAHAEARCKTAKLFTSTNQSNARMQALLSKLGYQPSGIIQNLDENDPELVYVKRLEDRSSHRQS